jgi:quercetin dioxygenase-like cupin family protein
VLSYQLAGEVDYEQNGRLTLRRGDLLVIPAGQAHRITRAAGADIWSAKIETAALDPERFASVLDAVRV